MSNKDIKLDRQSDHEFPEHKLSVMEILHRKNGDKLVEWDCEYKYKGSVYPFIYIGYSRTHIQLHIRATGFYESFHSATIGDETSKYGQIKIIGQRKPT